MTSDKSIVVVTGASGCLGQHIVKLLQERDDSVKEIRLFDVNPYTNKLGHEEKKPMKTIVGDIRNLDSLLKAFDGADCVIHTAAVCDVSLFPDEQLMKSVNINGTKNVIEACIQKNVPRLVFSSTTDVVIGGEHIFYGTESTTPIPNSFVLGPYAETKSKAENLVLDASSQTLADGTRKLRTLALRPTPVYGEQDNHFVYVILRNIKKNNGYYRRVRSLDERLQITYVGNAAWAHINAKDKLAVDESISGESFFVTDDSPIIDVHESIRPYIEAQGFKLSDKVYSYWPAWFVLCFFCFLLRLINYVVKLDGFIPSPAVLDYMCSTFFYNRSKATLRLDYQPVYTPEESQEKSLQYYSNLLL